MIVGRNWSLVSNCTDHMKSNMRISPEFQRYYLKMLENHVDTVTMMVSKYHDVVIRVGYYVSAVSLDPTNISIIVKYRKTRAGLLEEELISVTEV